MKKIQIRLTENSIEGILIQSFKNHEELSKSSWMRIAYLNLHSRVLNKSRQNGFSLVELMVGLTLGLMLSIAVIGVYVAQMSTYKTNTAQATIQSAENAITGLITPIIRSAGFCGCTTVLKANSNLNAGGPPPLGTLNTTPSMIRGYDAAAGTTINITQTNMANGSNASLWSPSLDASLLGNIQSISDVLIVLGPSQGSAPIAVSSITSGSSSLVLQSSSGITSGQIGAISDCLKATVFKVTGVSGNTISHLAGSGALTNASDAFSVNYPIGSQFVPLSQTAFFVANDPSGQSALVRATLNSTGTWTLQSLIPNVDTMQVLYGIGSNGSLSQYVPASGVTSWDQVYAVRIAFLLSGLQGSSTKSPTQFNLMGTTVNVPSDNKLRHVFEITINLRNTNS